MTFRATGGWTFSAPPVYSSNKHANSILWTGLQLNETPLICFWKPACGSQIAGWTPAKKKPTKTNTKTDISLYGGVIQWSPGVYFPCRIRDALSNSIELKRERQRGHYLSRVPTSMFWSYKKMTVFWFVNRPKPLSIRGLPWAMLNKVWQEWYYDTNTELMVVSVSAISWISSQPGKEPKLKEGVSKSCPWGTLSCMS